ncbi:1-phosphofructokinase family hexose kinase [Nocardioides speluncae]|uniref:1-phosphofructokinase family hexose kinase n=1 Tax=Nocardioides speluncae TaxID=2670337 RepID=UPI000D69C304|nr:1-phosphofructokinase [Nocardioides speluncae]
MILTLTANPSIDRAVLLSTPLKRHAVLRSEVELEQAGGKGVNISRAAVAAGVPTLAVLPAAADSDFVHELQAAGIACHPEEPAGPVRVNLTITEPDGATTKINSPGATVDASAMKRLSDAVIQHAAGADWVVLAGSLPPGADDDWYADLMVELRGSRVRVAVDTSDGPLVALGRRLPEATPALLKPNAEELAQLTGALVHDADEAAAAAGMLVDRGAGAVLATLGSGGAVLVDAESAWLATPPETQVVSTVGAGDSSLFGYLLGDLRGAPPDERLRLAVAYGTAAVGLPGTTIPAPNQIRPERVDVRRLG